MFFVKTYDRVRNTKDIVKFGNNYQIIELRIF